VLTGGACASLYAGGVYQSYDVDFVLRGDVRLALLDSAMGEAGFQRNGGVYIHPVVPITVEFPAGPLAIGRDAGIRPIRRRMGGQTVLSLSATDSCRDRLAAYYFWGDRQSLETAVEIALRHRVDHAEVRRWSVEEGAQAGYAAFLRRLRTARRHPGGKGRSRG